MCRRSPVAAIFFTNTTRDDGCAPITANSFISLNIGPTGLSPASVRHAGSACHGRPPPTTLLLLDRQDDLGETNHRAFRNWPETPVWGAIRSLPSPVRNALSFGQGRADHERTLTNERTRRVQSPGEGVRNGNKHTC